MSRLYTKTGDNGTTNLYDMRKCSKTDIVFDVLGTLDELSAHIGLVCVLLGKSVFIEILRAIQNRLLDIGSDIATVSRREYVRPITNEDIDILERYIDESTAKTPKLTEFILPGYTEIDAHIHICRGICRRLEREMWKWRESPTVNIETSILTFKFINRLSDFFFAIARVCSEGKDITRSQAGKMY